MRNKWNEPSRKNDRIIQKLLVQGCERLVHEIVDERFELRCTADKAVAVKETDGGLIHRCVEELRESWEIKVGKRR
jgi:hypothetical protein